MNNQPILNLDGYLLSLRRLSGNLCDFWAEIFDINGDVEVGFREHLVDREITLLDRSPVGYKEIDVVLEKHLLSKLGVEDVSLLKLFSWDIVEFIQMSFRHLDPEIDPISTKQAFLINAESGFHGQYIYIVIPVINQAIAIGLAIRA
ncbi:MAG: hypothetical protein V4660_20740 [Pseudomonadota bacterium]